MITTKTLAQLVLSNNSMSNKKLQKMCYYVYSWYLTFFNMPISDTKFEAWVHGPVSYDIYISYKNYGWQEIPKYNDFLIVDKDVRSFVDKIVKYYIKYSADELEKMSHEELPWQKARGNNLWCSASRELIKDEDIIEYYSTCEKRIELEKLFKD